MRPPLARLVLCIIASSPYFVRSQSSHGDDHSTLSKERILCRPFGACEKCPKASLGDAACQYTGNRRLVHCLPASTVQSLDPHLPASQLVDGEKPAWEPCGKIVAVERADYWEFVACNVLFALIGLVVVYSRTKRMAAIQYKNLMARVGVARGSIGWSSTTHG